MEKLGDYFIKTWYFMYGKKSGFVVNNYGPIINDLVQNGWPAKWWP